MSFISNDNGNIFSKKNTYGFIFNGEDISDKSGIVKFMSITIDSEYNHSSLEELRLADYENIQTEKIYKSKIDSTSTITKDEITLSSNNQFNSLNLNEINNEDKNNNCNLFGNINDNTNNKNDSNNINLFGNNEKENIICKIKNKSTRNNVIIPYKKINKCNHEDDFTCYCLENPTEEGGLLCYDCLYKYHQDHIYNCIPIKINNFENYKKYYKEYINKHKIELKKKFDDIISKIDEYENEEIDSISNLFEEKVNLDFELPVELSFIKRFEIAINRKISSLIKELEYFSLVNTNCLNLFNNNLKDLKYNEKNPNFFENIKLESSIDFNLKGIGLPKISEIENKEIEIKIYKGHILMGEITKFQNYDNLTIGYFNSIDLDLIEIENGCEYSIQFKGIKDCDYINNEEYYNNNSYIKIYSNNSETVLACLIIE